METFFVMLGLIFSLSATAEERGHRLVSANDWNHLQLSEHPQDDGNLSLLLDDGAGHKIQNDSLVGALDSQDDSVASYNVSVKNSAGDSVVVSSVKNWGTSNWEFRYQLARSDSRFVVSRFDYTFKKRDKRIGSCSLDLVGGQALVNGRARTFTLPDVSLAHADGLELQGICERLGAN
jgi:hypothetical protein